MLKPRPKKAINRYPSEVILPFALTYMYTHAHARGERPSAYTRVSRHGPQVCEAFWALSRNAEWVMHPAQARRRQMNYNISFSRPYIPTDSAYWRSLIAFNSLLVHPCNKFGPKETHCRRYDRSVLSPPFSSIDPRVVLPSSRIPSVSISRHRLVVKIILFLLFPLQRRDRLTLMQPLIVRGGRREVSG